MSFHCKGRDDSEEKRVVKQRAMSLFWRSLYKREFSILREQYQIFVNTWEKHFTKVKAFEKIPFELLFDFISFTYCYYLFTFDNFLSFLYTLWYFKGAGKTKLQALWIEGIVECEWWYIIYFLIGDVWITRIALVLYLFLVLVY